MTVHAKSPLLVLVGPTAVGKTALSLQLAEALGTDIISGDSMCIYRGFDIGSAKPTAEEQARVPHHLIDVLDADEPFSVTEFVTRVSALVHVHERTGRLPFIVGGTGLYIKALIEGYDFNETQEHSCFRRAMERIAQRCGNERVHGFLTYRDPTAAARLHANNLRRVIRALETLRYGAEHISQESAMDAGDAPYDAFVIGLTRARAHLYERINMRVEAMFAAGLADEVAGLLACGISRAAPAMKGIGYKETAAYLAGEMSFAETLAAIQTATRRFAKRQMTWYRRMPYIHWYDADTQTETELLHAILADVRAWQCNRERSAQA
ncbi:tRNA (adenosine(37)-N6)-dimethylallyltransferase MiaA [Selenomonas sp. oral taxon 138]|uniref:tRNA (adenosine(37)-N6)-dimethylallyltransferase MiaA n=1 Tax=Selenomonas sp. oral taxon 138 TaxID=712532 RepID=UPI0002A41876|nr:tRNA (adenosine(37)-N6)-dimethylallyltransferase MiaA [Selenomonas sp. oral taxon 138]EKX94864.1 tRNA dimethylallyltransferase [Selenomonas sp. oral taxon 138 str. F0429]